METNIYLDVYFCFNFLMDFFVIYIATKFYGGKYSAARMSLPALIGALYSTVVLVLGQTNLLELFLTYIVIPVVMALILIKPRIIRNIIKFLGLLYLVTFIVSGIINAIYYSGKAGKSIVDKATNANIGGINIGAILVVLILCVSVVDCIRKVIKKDISLKENIYDVTVIVGERKIKGYGLRDTGNQLREPMTGKSVVIIEEELLKDVDKQQLKPVIIPFNSVGKEHGLMEGFVGDLLIVEGESVSKPIIGIHKGKLDGKNQYNLILPPNILDEERV